MSSLLTSSMMMPPSKAPSSTTAKPIPGSYGLPILGPLKDRLDYFWFQGPDSFFQTRMTTLKSTVFRTNMPPTFPFFGNIDPRVICVLDCASFSHLFDLSLVSKRNILIGSYMPSTKFTGNTRVAVYQDPLEPSHAKVKNFCMELLKRSSNVWVQEFKSNLDQMLTTVETEISSKGSSSFLLPLQKCIFRFLAKSIAGADTMTSQDIHENGHIMLDTWLSLQLLPTVKVGAIPQPLEELLLHSFPYPYFLVSSSYNKLYDFVKKEGQGVIQCARKEHNIDEEEAIHNILFVLGFNAFGGFSVFFPSLISTLGKDSVLFGKLCDEVRTVMEGKDGVDFSAVKEMALVKSTVYEVLRLNPPVPLQFGRARKDFVLSSHDSSFRVKEGELLCGYQPIVMKDPVVFEDPDSFKAKRFMEDESLLDYLFWSNGPESSAPTAANKQCAAKDYVVLTACLFVAEICCRYDKFGVNDKGEIVEAEKKKKVGAESNS